jgi:hypothetical protein
MSPKQFKYLDSYSQYEQVVTQQLGVNPKFTDGIFSLCKESEFMPYLCGVEDLPQNMHYFMSCVDGKKRKQSHCDGVLFLFF